MENAIINSPKTIPTQAKKPVSLLNLQPIFDC